MKLVGHLGCPGVNPWDKRKGRRGKVVRLYYRHRISRKWVAVGILCLDCGKADIYYTDPLVRQ